MRGWLEEISDPVKTAALRSAIRNLEQESINRNEPYVATATPGVSYTAVIAASSKQHVIVFSSDHQVIVAQTQYVTRADKTKEVHFKAN